jgi:hypothetical protein
VSLQLTSQFETAEGKKTPGTSPTHDSQTHPVSSGRTGASTDLTVAKLSSPSERVLSTCVDRGELEPSVETVV